MTGAVIQRVHILLLCGHFLLITLLDIVHVLFVCVQRIPVDAGLEARAVGLRYALRNRGRAALLDAHEEEPRQCDERRYGRG